MHYGKEMGILLRAIIKDIEGRNAEDGEGARPFLVPSRKWSEYAISILFFNHICNFLPKNVPHTASLLEGLALLGKFSNVHCS